MATTRDIDRVVRTYIDPQAHDITFSATPWVKRCEAKAKKRASMGTYMEYPLEVAAGQAGTYTDLQQIDSQRVNIMDKAYFYIKEYYAQLTVSWTDMKTCRGPEDVVGLLDVKAKNAQKSLGYTLSSDSLTGSTARQLVGLNSLIYAGSSNTVGGHASTEYTGWKNQYTSIGGTLTIPDIITFGMTCSDGNDVPTVILTDKFIVAYVWGNLLQQQERYSGEYNMAKDLPAVACYPMMWDAALESSGTGGLMYFINENYFGWDILSADNMKYWPYAKADSQFAFKCQWTLTVIQRMTNRMRQGVLYGITTS
jgi:hypothetical protein